MSQTRDQRPTETPVPQKQPEPVRAQDAANRLAGRSGAELPPEVRQPLESRLDADFSQVRIHTDRPAAEAASALGARAFTLGPHIAFDAGEYRPGSTTGRHLLAHELAHVVQQKDASPGHAVPSRDSGQEREAQAAAERIAEGRGRPPGLVPRGGSVRIQADEGEGKKGEKKADQDDADKKAGVTITFVIRAPDDEFTQDVSDYVTNTLGEQVVEVDNIQEAAEYVAKYAKTNKTKVGQIRLVGHGSTTGGIKMTPKGETGRRFVTPKELTTMAADKKIASIAKDAMAPGATVEFWGCHVGGTKATGQAVGKIFGGADFKAIDDTLRTGNDRFARMADKGEDGKEVKVGKKTVKVVEVSSTKEIDDRVAAGNKELGESFDKWLVARSNQLEADGDLPPQKDDPARIKTMREIFDRSGGKIKRLQIESGGKSIHRSEKKKWMSKWKTVKAN